MRINESKNRKTKNKNLMKNTVQDKNQRRKKEKPKQDV